MTVDQNADRTPSSGRLSGCRRRRGRWTAASFTALVVVLFGSVMSEGTALDGTRGRTQAPGTLRAIPVPGDARPSTNGLTAHSRRATSLTVTTQKSSIPKVSSGLSGGNPRWFRNADGILSASGTIDTTREARARMMGLRSVRYPGGTVANLFDASRFDAAGITCQTSGGFVQKAFTSIDPSDSTFSPALAGQFVDDIGHGARINLMLPMVNTTLADAQRLVTAIKRQQGSVNVEVGNEPYMDIQRYWRSNKESTRMRQYALGGIQDQSAGRGAYAQGDGLFPTRQCDLAHPATANGDPDQVYRSRFWPIATGKQHRPVATVAGEKWHYVRSLAGQSSSARVFTVNDPGTKVIFGDGTHGARPNGAMHFRYAVRGLGFADFYHQLHAAGVNVCASYGRYDFVRLMQDKGKPYDCLTFHSYVDGRYVRKGLSTAEMFGRLRDLVGDRLAYLRSLGSMVRAGHPDRFLMVTEYGVLNPPIPGEQDMLLSDLLLAQQLMGQVRAGVKVSNIFDFETPFVGSGSDQQLSSRARLLQLFSHLAGQRPLRTTGPLPSQVKVVATQVGDTTRLLVLNERIGSGSYSPSLRVAGGDTERCVQIRRMSGSVSASNLPGTNGLPETATTQAHMWQAHTRYRPDFGNHSLSLLTIGPVPAGGCQAPTADTW